MCVAMIGFSLSRKKSLVPFFWFHPGVWWLLNRIQLSREQAVDYEVVRLTGNKQPYLDSLLEFARAQGRPRAVPAPLFLKESHLVQRVALLLKEVSMSRSRLAVSMISIFLLLIRDRLSGCRVVPFDRGAPGSRRNRDSGAEVRAPRTTPIQVAGDIQESKLIFRVEPIYPEEANRLGLNGIVKLRVTINEEGQVYGIVDAGRAPDVRTSSIRCRNKMAL